mmetsp:Transcript_37256/g.89030  ORF Transcript_37256/g.89030 Transcript_37256/m.89030 type:complete len:212 (+) Transcript_37256:491-1126(+)
MRMLQQLSHRSRRGAVACGGCSNLPHRQARSCCHRRHLVSQQIHHVVLVARARRRHPAERVQRCHAQLPVLGVEALHQPRRRGRPGAAQVSQGGGGRASGLPQQRLELGCNAGHSQRQRVRVLRLVPQRLLQRGTLRGCRLPNATQRSRSRRHHAGLRVLQELPNGPHQVGGLASQTAREIRGPQSHVAVLILQKGHHVRGEGLAPRHALQ